MHGGKSILRQDVDLLFRHRLIKVRNQITEFRRILGAVLMQDMRSRFGSNHFGYLIAIGWPLSHMAVLTAAFLLRTEIAPVGDSPTMFIATGVVPYILCLYPARMMALAISENRQLLNIPIIMPLHLIFSRCILETLNALIVLSLFIFIIYLFDVDVIPFEPTEAAKAVGAAVFFGIGLGFLNVVLCALVGRYFLLFFLLSMVLVYIFSGVHIPTWVFPETVQTYMRYNPLLHLVEWLRSVYYTSYDTDLIDKPMVLWIGGGSLAFGLVGERFLRGKLL
jgi:capsular polysaccharide transport system permease protein